MLIIEVPVFISVAAAAYFFYQQYSMRRGWGIIFFFFFNRKNDNNWRENDNKAFYFKYFIHIFNVFYERIYQVFQVML